MFSSSTQKSHWMFESAEKAVELRTKANAAYRRRFDGVLAADDPLASAFLDADDEAQLCQLVAETGRRFAETFQPPMWPSVVWTAFSYFKRFFLRHSTMEFTPKSVMMASFYMACKVDEFNVSIDDFVRNLRSGTAESNAELVLAMESTLLAKLDFQLTVHCPSRALEGHLVDMRTRWRRLADADAARAAAAAFLLDALLSDACLLFPPSQIALAALRRARLTDGATLDDYISSCLFADDAAAAAKLSARLTQIVAVVDSVRPLGQAASLALQQKAQRWIDTFATLNQRLAEESGSRRRASKRPAPD